VTRAALVSLLLVVVAGGCGQAQAADPAPVAVVAPAPAPRAAPKPMWQRMRDIEASVLAAEPTGEALVDAYVQSCDFTRLFAAEADTGGKLLVGDECSIVPYAQDCSFDAAPCGGRVAHCQEHECGGRCRKCASTCVPRCDACKAACKDAACVRRCAVDRAACRDECMAGLDTCRAVDCTARYEPCMTAWRADRLKRCGSTCAAYETCTREELSGTKTAAQCDKVGARMSKQCRFDCANTEQ
jgi:hypothetical protein